MDDEQKNKEPDSQIAETPAKKIPVGGSRWHRFKNWYSTHQKWSIPTTVILVLILIFGIPWTRYKAAGLVLKKNFTVGIIDSTSHTPVSGASVSYGGQSALTDGSGKATLHLADGHHRISISKKYYQAHLADVLVPILGQKNTPAIQLQATGRQVKVVVKNLISKKTLGDVDIKVADTTAKTDKNGSAIVVIPASSSTEKATLSLDGYNVSDVTLKASDSKILENDFSLTPNGKIYFLSKLSGKIDVVKTNLDGSNRQTVLAGTGSEDDQNTVLLASRDWKFLALLSRRAGNSPTLYLIDTSNDNLTTMESGSSSFNLVGWSGHRFVYVITRNNINDWQLGKEALKSYSADTKSAALLDQTSGSGTNQYDYIRETFGSEYSLNSGEIVYSKNWTAAISAASEAAILTKQATFNGINPDGTNHKSIKSFGLAPGTQAIAVRIDIKPAKPNEIYIDFQDGTKSNLYEYSNGQVTATTDFTNDSFYSAGYATYLLSPSANSAFWSEPRDGKNTLFIGDDNGKNGKQIATLSDYFTYGWYKEEYLLVSKNGSELYIIPTEGVKSDSEAIKITDYHKSAQSFFGYGGGYGGI